MNNQTLGLRAAGTIFGLVALAHLLRLVTWTEVMIAGHPVPFWPSALAALAAGGLSLWLWKLSITHNSCGGTQ